MIYRVCCRGKISVNHHVISSYFELKRAGATNYKFFHIKSMGFFTKKPEFRKNSLNAETFYPFIVDKNVVNDFSEPLHLFLAK